MGYLLSIIAKENSVGKSSHTESELLVNQGIELITIEMYFKKNMILVTTKKE